MHIERKIRNEIRRVLSEVFDQGLIRAEEIEHSVKLINRNFPDFATATLIDPENDVISISLKRAPYSKEVGNIENKFSEDKFKIELMPYWRQKSGTQKF